MEHGASSHVLSIVGLAGAVGLPFLDIPMTWAVYICIFEARYVRHEAETIYFL